MYLLDIYITQGVNFYFLSFLFAIALFFAISVIVTKNPIVSVLFLIAVFSIVSCYLILIGFEFIGLSYLLVYVGAISILFLFILMLINIRVSELITDNNNSIPLSLIIITVFGTTFNGMNGISHTYINAEDKVNLSFSPAWDNTLFEVSHISNLGNILYSSHVILLLLVSLILLLSMIGSIIITIKQ